MILCVLLIIAVITLIINMNEREGYYGGYYDRERDKKRGWWERRRRYLYGRRRPPPPPPRYLWYNPWYWFSGPCKKGCTSIGNGNWGCQYPGPGPNDCWFANDCYGCGY